MIKVDRVLSRVARFLRDLQCSTGRVQLDSNDIRQIFLKIFCGTMRLSLGKNVARNVPKLTVDPLFLSGFIFERACPYIWYNYVRATIRTRRTVSKGRGTFFPFHRTNPTLRQDAS